MRGTRRGIALIIVVGVLAVLAVVATAFVMMAELERKASRQRMLSTKAYLLARSGIEDALARLAAGQDPDASSNRYRGEDLDGDGVLDAGLETTEQVYRPGVLDISLCPLRHAMGPSYFVNDGTGPGALPARVAVDARQRGYSGILAGDFAARGNTYALKVSMPEGFFVNGGSPAALPGTGYNAVLRRVLGTLAEAIDLEDGTNDALPVDQLDGEALINARPLVAAGWLSFDQIRTAALGGSLTKLDALKPYLRLKAWVDGRVIAPNGSGVLGSDVQLQRRGPAPSLLGRAPVYLGWARSRRPALIALLADLRGLYLDESKADTVVTSWDWVGMLQAADITNTWSAADPCHVAADWILTSTSPLSTWQEWNAFCDTIPFTAVSSSAHATSDLRQAMRDTLKANFNPNSDLTKSNPNLSLWKLVDKSDVVTYSTEFIHFPVQDRELESVGRVLSGNGRLLAIRTLRGTLRGPLVVRLSTQKEFVCGNLGNLDQPGDETGARLPGDSPYISLSLGASRTWGHTRLELSTTPPGGPWRGIALQSYPQPYVATGGGGTALSINPANCDGNLQLATIETLDNQLYLVSSAPNNMMMLARFDDGFDLDLADAFPGVPDALLCSGDAGVMAPAALGTSVHSGNTLYPDGAYSERSRVPAYFDEGSANGFHGLLSFWFKATQFISNPVNWHGNTYVTRDNIVDVGFPDTQVFWLGYYTRFTPPQAPTGWDLHVETGHATDAKKEFLFQTPHRLAPKVDQAHRWSLLTCSWDFNAAKRDGVADVVVDQGLAAVDRDGPNLYNKDSPTIPDDITLGDMYGRHKTALGQWRANANGPMGSTGSNATMDEFAIYDFGAGKGDGTLAAPYASERYREGRYYKCAAYYAPGASGAGQAGSWVSAPIALPAGSLLQAVYWTWYCPLAPPTPLPDDYAEIELLDNAGAASLWPSGSRSGRRDGQSWTLNRLLPAEAFRAKVHFTRDGASVAVPEGVLPANTPLLDSPVFDDLTFVCLPPGGVNFLSWKEGE